MPKFGYSSIDSCCSSRDPVLVFAFHHGLQRRPGKAVALTQQCTQCGERKVPVGHDRVDRSIKVIQLGHRGVEQLTEIDLAELGLVDSEQLMEPVVVGSGDGTQRADVFVVQSEHENILHTNGGFLTLCRVNARLQ